MDIPKGWAQPKDKKVLKRMHQALRQGGRGRTKRLRKKRDRGIDAWFDLHISNGGYLP